MLKRLCVATIITLFVMLSPVQAAGPMINMNVTNAEVRDVLTALAGVGKVSIVADDSVTGKITITLHNIPFDTALDLVTKTKGLVYQKIGEVIVVADGNKMSKGFGVMQIIKLKYASAEDVVKTVAFIFDQSPASATTGADSNSRIKFDKATNSIIFLGTPAESEQVQRILAELDIPYQQVSLEAEVVAISKLASKDLGIDWKWDMTPTYPEYEPEKYSNIYDANGNLVRREIDTPAKYTRKEHRGTIQYGRSPLGIPYEFYYQAKISALVTDGKAKVLAKPKITAINGKEAKILIGDRIPVLSERTENGASTTTIEYVEAGIKLIYTPQINADGQITAKVHTEVSTPTLVPEMKAYRITTREAETQVRMKDGETMVIGGLIGSEESGGKNRVPFLSDLPILGKLFQSVHKSKNETEVVIFLTARIIK